MSCEARLAFDRRVRESIGQGANLTVSFLASTPTIGRQWTDSRPNVMTPSDPTRIGGVATEMVPRLSDSTTLSLDTGMFATCPRDSTRRSRYLAHREELPSTP